MVVRRRKKSRKIRGAKTGRGSGKRARGAGNRGGRGRAGLGKRASHKKSMLIAHPELGGIGKHGFVSVKQKKKLKQKAINVKMLDSIVEKLVSMKLAEKKDDYYEIDLSKLGYSKLIGTGFVKNKIYVHVKQFSESAKNKIEAAGGKIISE